MSDSQRQKMEVVSWPPFLELWPCLVEPSTRALESAPVSQASPLGCCCSELRGTHVQTIGEQENTHTHTLSLSLSYKLFLAKKNSQNLTHSLTHTQTCTCTNTRAHTHTHLAESAHQSRMVLDLSPLDQGRSGALAGTGATIGLQWNMDHQTEVCQRAVGTSHERFTYMYVREKK